MPNDEHILTPQCRKLEHNHNLSNVAIDTVSSITGVANQRVFHHRNSRNVLVPFRNCYLPMVLVISFVVALSNF